ncbi:MAG: ribonuclease J [Sphingomonadaceae bacterium]
MTTPGNELLFLALGGSGEIGMNVNLYGTEGKWLMVDLGLTFADPAYPGVDLVLPDLEFIEERRENLVGIVLTHGHEDHIGAIPYLAADLGAPLYATPFTAGLIAAKLEEEGIAEEIELDIVEMGGDFTLGPFGLRYVPLAHSIPEGNALLIDTPHGRIFHTGDWKLDDSPQIGDPSTAEELTRIGDAGVLALICDSTNVFNEAASGSEAEVREGLDRVISEAGGRVLVTTFASNAARLKTLGHVAADTGRRICIAGRSLERILRISRSVGYLSDFPDPVDFDAAMALPPEKLMIVATGGQGEPRAALARIAAGNHPLELDRGDLVIFSSKEIPGNELAIGRIQNALAANGIRMITERQAFVHVSGHPGRPELAEMYRWIRPEIIVPVHGEMRHMAEQARFARAQGVPHGIVQQNGDLVRLAPGGPTKIGEERTGRLVLDGDIIVPADGAAVGERRKLSRNGHVAVALALGRDGRPAADPLVSLNGVPIAGDEREFVALLAKAAAEAAAGAGRGSGKRGGGREAVRLAVRRAAARLTGKKPVVDVLWIEC